MLKEFPEEIRELMDKYKEKYNKRLRLEFFRRNT